MKRFLTISVFLVSSLITYAQHSPILGHYLNNQLPINPAFTGYQGSPEANLSFRKQWMNLNGSPNTQLLSWSTRMRDDKNAIGGVLYRDEIGITRTFGFHINYAHIFKLTTDLNLSLGISGGINSVRNEWNLIETTDPNDQAFITPMTKVMLPSASFGGLLFSKKFFVTASVLNLITSQQIGDQLETGTDLMNLNYLLGGGYSHKLNPDLNLNFGVLIKYRSQSPLQADLTVSTEIKETIKAGLSYRSGDAIVVLLGYNINKQFTVGYQYDLTISRLAPYSAGSHEINLRYLFRYDHATANPRFF